MSPADLARLVGLAAVWGLAFVFIRVAVPPFGPIGLTFVRTILAGSALALYAYAIGVAIGWRFRWPRFVTFGVLNSAIPFVLVAAAEEAMTASFAAILVATAPLFAAVIAAVWVHEGLTLRKLAGLVLGIAGVALLVGWKPADAELPPAWAIAATLAAAAFYGLAANYTKIKTGDIPPMATAAGSQLAAGVLLVPLAAFSPPVATPTALEWTNALVLAFASSAFAFVLYLRLIANVGAVKTMTVNFLSPLFGVTGGVLLLGEPITANMVAGTVVILGATALVVRGA